MIAEVARFLDAAGDGQPPSKFEVDMRQEVVRPPRMHVAKVAAAILCANPIATPANADDFDAYLRKFAQSINDRGEMSGQKVSATVEGRTLTFSIASNLPLPPDTIPKLGIRDKVCVIPAVRTAMTHMGFIVRILVSAPNLSAPIVTPVRAADCGGVAGPAPARLSAATAGQKAAVGSSAAGSAGNSRPFDFKGVPLGMAYEDFRRLPHPDGQRAQVICTGQKAIIGGVPAEPSGVDVSDPIEAAIGVRKCVWISLESRIAGSVDTVSLGLVGTAHTVAGYSFDFAPDPKDGVLRLFRFSGLTDYLALDTVVEALTIKYGKGKIVTDTVQNGLGKSIARTTAEWSNASGSIVVKSPTIRASFMSISMTDKRMLKVIDDAGAAKRAAVPNGI